MDVSDRRMQVQLTQEAKIATDFLFIGAIFAVVGFVSALNDPASDREAGSFLLLPPIYDGLLRFSHDFCEKIMINYA